MNQQQIESLQRCVLKVYCLPYCNEFRQPIQILHPDDDFLKSYASIIHNPMDLGTVLLKIRNKEYNSIVQCRSDIKLIFNNAVVFNSDSSNLVSMSKHVAFYTKNLWHEIMNLSYDDGDENDFSELRFCERETRYQKTREEHILWSESKELYDRISKIDITHDFMVKLHQNFMNKLLQVCDRSCDMHNNEHQETGEDDDKRTPSPSISMSSESLCDILSSFVSDVMSTLDNITNTTSYSDQDVPHLTTPSSSTSSHENVFFSDFEKQFPYFIRHEVIYGSDYSEDDLKQMYTSSMQSSKLPHLLSYLNDIDSIISELCVSLEERLLRGVDLSSVWARYHDILWVQPNKSPWWPAMLLAGTGVPPLISESNFARMPFTILDALSKLRPKTIEIDVKTKKRVFVGTGVCLVEYFGSHDFGWVKPELCSKYPMGGHLVLPAAHKKAHLSIQAIQLSERITTDASAHHEARVARHTLDEVKSENFVPSEDFLDILELAIKQLQPFSSYVHAASVDALLHSETIKDSTGMKQVKRIIVKKSNDESKASMIPGGNNSKKSVAMRKCKELAAMLQHRNPIIVPEPSSRGKPSGSTRVSNDGDLQLHNRNDAFNDMGMDVNGDNDSDDGDEEDGVGGENAADGAVPRKKRHRRRDTTVLNAGCTCEVKLPASAISGGTVVHTRIVDPNASLFYKESWSKELRKKYLREELRELDKALNHTISISQVGGGMRGQEATRCGAGGGVKSSNSLQKHFVDTEKRSR